MKKNLYIYGLLLLIISTNIALIVRNNVLNKAIKEYISEEYINMDYKTQLYNYIDARIYEQTLEKNVKVRLETFMDSLALGVDDRVILFVFDEFDCEYCLERVFEDLKKTIKFPTVLAGQFLNEKSYLSFIDRHELNHDLFFCEKNDFFYNEDEYIKPFLAVYDNSDISNIYVIDKIFDKSYLFYINNVLVNSPFRIRTKNPK